MAGTALGHQHNGWEDIKHISLIEVDGRIGKQRRREEMGGLGGRRGTVLISMPRWRWPGWCGYRILMQQIQDGSIWRVVPLKALPNSTTAVNTPITKYFIYIFILHILHIKAYAKRWGFFFPYYLFSCSPTIRSLLNLFLYWAKPQKFPLLCIILIKCNSPHCYCRRKMVMRVNNIRKGRSSYFFW